MAEQDQKQIVVVIDGKFYDVLYLPSLLRETVKAVELLKARPHIQDVELTAAVEAMEHLSFKIQQHE